MGDPRFYQRKGKGNHQKERDKVDWVWGFEKMNMHIIDNLSFKLTTLAIKFRILTFVILSIIIKI